MGICYEAKVVVGCPASDLPEWGYGEVEDAEMEIISPRFGGPINESLIGFVVESCSRWTEFDPAITAWGQDEMKTKFKELTGIDAKVFLTLGVF